MKIINNIINQSSTPKVKEMQINELTIDSQNPEKLTLFAYKTTITVEMYDEIIQAYLNGEKVKIQTTQIAAGYQVATEIEILYVLDNYIPGGSMFSAVAYQEIPGLNQLIGIPSICVIGTIGEDNDIRCDFVLYSSNG